MRLPSWSVMAPDHADHIRLDIHQILHGQGAARMRREDSQMDQINHYGRDRSEALCNGSEQR